jgi:hypothetical protein
MTLLTNIYWCTIFQNYFILPHRIVDETCGPCMMVPQPIRNHFETTYKMDRKAGTSILVISFTRSESP